MAAVMKYLLAVFFVALIGTVAALQMQVSHLTTALTQARAEATADDARLATALEALTKNIFGEEAVRSNPLPVAFREPGRKCEGQIYRISSLGNQLANQLPHR